MKNISQRCDELRYASSPHTILDEGRKGWRKEKKHTKNDMTHCECTPLEYQVKKDGSHLSPTKCMTRVYWRFDLLRDKQIKWMLPSSPITQLSTSILFLLPWIFFFFFWRVGSCHAHAFSGMARYPRRPQIFNESHHFQIIYCLL